MTPAGGSLDWLQWWSWGDDHGLQWLWGDDHGEQSWRWKLHGYSSDGDAEDIRGSQRLEPATNWKQFPVHGSSWYHQMIHHKIWNRNVLGWNSGAKESDLSWRPTNFLCILWSKFWKWVSKNLSKYWKQFRYLEFIVWALFIPKSWNFKAHFPSTSFFVYDVIRVKDVTRFLIIENRKIFLLCFSKSWSCCTNMHVAHKGQSKADWLHFKWKLLQAKLWQRIFLNTK